MINWLVKKTIKNSNETESPQVRKSYTYLAGVVGMVVNFLLFAMKVAVGFFVGSIAIMADGFNNLSDMASSAVTVVGIRLSQMPADKEHPYGHGRLEYIAALIVAFLVMLVGFQLGQSSIGRIINPTVVTFDMISFALLFLSVLAKLWLSRFSMNIGKKIHSAPLKAAGVDSLGDVLLTGTVLISFALSPFLTYSIDGYVGILVAIFILYMGYKLVRETISPLLGEAPAKEIVQGIHEKIKTYPYVVGSHDLHFHNYGVGRVMATLHVEFAGCNDLMEMHDIVDQAEREISKEFNLHLVIHMDPVSQLSEEALAMKRHLNRFIATHPVILSMHDFRMLQTSEPKTVVFDLDIDASKLSKEVTEESVHQEVTENLLENFPDFNCLIAVDRQYLD